MSHHKKDVSGFSYQEVNELVERRPELETVVRLDVVAVGVLEVEALTTAEFSMEPS